MSIYENGYDLIADRQKYLRREAEISHSPKAAQDGFESERRERRTGRALAGYFRTPAVHAKA